MANANNYNAQGQNQMNQFNSQMLAHAQDLRAAEYDRYISENQKNLQNIGDQVAGRERDNSYRNSNYYYGENRNRYKGYPEYARLGGDLYSYGGNLSKSFQKKHNINNESDFMKALRHQMIHKTLRNKTNKYSRNSAYINN